MEDMKNFVQNIDKEKLSIVLQIKNDFNSGKIGLQEAKNTLKEKVKILSPVEIAFAEQQLKEFEDDECRKDDIQNMLVLFEDIMDTSRPELPPEHPVMCYYRENDALLKIMLEIEDLVQYPVIKNQWLEIYDKLTFYKLHFSRKQNQLYSVLERKGFDRPTTTMWTLDDFIRDEIKQARALLENEKDDEFIAMQSTIVADIRDLISKENTILYPTSLAIISQSEFENMKAGDKEIGFAWIETNSTPQEQPAQNEDSFAKELMQLMQKYGYSAGRKDNLSTEKFEVAMGSLTLEQINLIYRYLPVDISFVDENESVCFYSDTEHRIFPRSKNVIGRNVKNCHPKASVSIVEEIINKFRTGEESSAEFWINKPDLFIYIYYTAVRDSSGNFKGVLEMMQDCTHIRKLQGSQTLLTWGSGKQYYKENSDKNDTENEKSAVPLQNDSQKDLFPLTADTKLSDLLTVYPDLKTKLAEINSTFKMLQTPLARIMIPKATIKIMSERSNMDMQELISAIEAKIKSR